MTESPLTVATRRSIQKLFPMGSILSSGRDNPITLHTAVPSDSTNSNLFACIWSLIAETMVVTVVLQRKTKEAIASLVSERNACPVCLAAHSFMGITAIVVDNQNGSGKGGSKKNTSSSSSNSSEKDKQLQHDQALQYAEVLLSEMKLSKRKCGAALANQNDANSTAGRSMSSGNSVGSGTLSTASSSMDLLEDDSDDDEDHDKKKRQRKEKRKRKKSRRHKKFTHLTPTAKSEVALVVMLFDHMNRVVSVIMGDEMSTAMFGVPRSLARAMEAPKAVKMMSRWMAPLVSGTFKVKHQPGVTLGLFENNTTSTHSTSSLPTNLQGVLLAGLERANAVGRLVDWVDSYERDTLLKQDLVSKHLIRFLDRTLNEPHEGVNFYSPDDVAQWMDETMKREVTAAIMGDDVSEASQEMNHSNHSSNSILATERAIAMVLLLASLAPQTAYQSTYWKHLVHRVGDNTARSIVIWWSLRTTFSECQGLNQPIDQATLLTLLTTAGVAPQ